MNDKFYSMLSIEEVKNGEALHFACGFHADGSIRTYRIDARDWMRQNGVRLFFTIRALLLKANDPLREIATEAIEAETRRQMEVESALVAACEYADEWFNRNGGELDDHDAAADVHMKLHAALAKARGEK